MYTTFKSEKESCAKFFFKNIDLTTLIVVAVHPKWNFDLKQIRFAQLLIRI